MNIRRIRRGVMADIPDFDIVVENLNSFHSKKFIFRLITFRKKKEPIYYPAMC